MAEDVWFSNGTAKHFLNQYPHLNEKDANFILMQSEVKSEPVDTIYWAGRTPLIKTAEFKMYVPNKIAQIYNIDTVVDLIPGEDGVIYYKNA